MSYLKLRKAWFFRLCSTFWMMRPHLHQEQITTKFSWILVVCSDKHLFILYVCQPLSCSTFFFINMSHFWEIRTEPVWGLLLINMSGWGVAHYLMLPTTLCPRGVSNHFSGVKKAPRPSHPQLTDLLLPVSPPFFLSGSFSHTFLLPHPCLSPHIPTSISFTLPPDVLMLHFTLLFLFLSSEPSNHIMSLIQQG